MLHLSFEANFYENIISVASRNLNQNVIGVANIYRAGFRGSVRGVANTCGIQRAYDFAHLGGRRLYRHMMHAADASHGMSGSSLGKIKKGQLVASTHIEKNMCRGVFVAILD